MKTMNSCWFDRLNSSLGQLYEGAPDDLQPFDSAKEPDWKRFFQKYTIPEYRSAHPRSQVEIKRVFRILLNKPDVNWERLYSSYDPGEQVPPGLLKRQIFIWMWEVLFPGEEWEMADAAEYVDMPDSHVSDSLYDERTYKPQ